MSRAALLDRLVEQIRELTPGERRRLMRLLQINGLLEPLDRLSDVDPLRVAPALSPEMVRRLSSLSQARSQPERPAETLYRSPVSGRVVLGGPKAEEPDPSVMPPLPGQAPEAPIRIVFDGGSKGNPGQGYGSYAVEWPGEPRQVVRLQFGDMVTNNEAEYDTLIAALEAVLKRLEEQGVDPATAKVEIWGDSQLVVNQVSGAWQCREPRLQPRRDRVRALMARFGQATLRYHPREQSVEELGH